MKTKNNIQKTALNSLATLGLLILGITVNAQDSTQSLFENYENSNLAMITGKMGSNYYNTATSNTKNLIKADAFATYLATETEVTLQLEDWMMEETNFAGPFKIEAETENPLQVEDWMINLNTFSNNRKESPVIEKQKSSKAISTATNFYDEVNIEDELVIEDWMLNPKTWRN